MGIKAPREGSSAANPLRLALEWSAFSPFKTEADAKRWKEDSDSGRSWWSERITYYM